MTKWPFFEEDEIETVSSILRSGKVNYWTGEECRLFEKEFAAFVGVNHAVAVSNGTVALELALHALDIGPGDEVIVPCRTFIATASCVVARGARPILADIDLISQNLTSDTIAALITEKTKAIIVVHLAGWPCEMHAILALAKKHNLYVIEDCAQAHGSTYFNKPVGSWGDVAAFSFCQDKIMTTGGEGGLITTNNADLYRKIWEYKDHGKSFAKVSGSLSSEGGFKWLHDSFGTNARMTEMQAAIGRLQLKKLNAWVDRRRQNAAQLNQLLEGMPGIRLTIPPDHIKHAYYKYYCFLMPEQLKPQWSQMKILQHIQEEGIDCFTGSCPEIYREEAFLRMGYDSSFRLPNANALAQTSLMFCVHPTLPTSYPSHCAEAIKRVMSKALR